jgi:ABC-2 type transport system ATP-binding protein
VEASDYKAEPGAVAVCRAIAAGERAVPSIEVTDLHKSYGSTVALAGVSFSVEPGEVVGFLGPNGAGKTTTMKILCGFTAPSAGTVRVDGLDAVADSLQVRQRIGYLPENAPLYTEMLVGDYLDFICSVRQLGPQQREARIAAVSVQLGLGSVLHRPIGELSKGFRQRVGLAQALVHDPPILVLDEPTSGLDPNQIAEIRALIRDIGKTRTILLSTHILQEVSALCSRVLIVSQGRIVGFGTPAEIEAQSACGRRIEVLVRGDDDLRSPLATLAGVLEVREAAGEGPNTRCWSLLCEGEADPRAAIFEAAVAGGWTLLGLHREPESLEEAFRALTLPS